VQAIASAPRQRTARRPRLPSESGMGEEGPGRQAAVDRAGRRYGEPGWAGIRALLPSERAANSLFHEGHGACWRRRRQRSILLLRVVARVGAWSGPGARKARELEAELGSRPGANDVLGASYITGRIKPARCLLCMHIVGTMSLFISAWHSSRPSRTGRAQPRSHVRIDSSKPTGQQLPLIISLAGGFRGEAS
jgi:hypothetical protein